MDVSDVLSECSFYRVKLLFRTSATANISCANVFFTQHKGISKNTHRLEQK